MPRQTSFFFGSKYIQLYLQKNKKKQTVYNNKQKGGVLNMQKSLQTNCLLPSQRSMQTDTLENQRILHAGSPALRRRGRGPRNQASLGSDGRGVQSP